MEEVSYSFQYQWQYDFMEIVHYSELNIGWD